MRKEIGGKKKGEIETQEKNEGTENENKKEDEIRKNREPSGSPIYCG